MKNTNTNVYERMVQKFTELYNEYNSINKSSRDITSLKSYNEAMISVYDFLSAYIMGPKCVNSTRSILLSGVDKEDILQEELLFVITRFSEIITHPISHWATRVCLYVKNHLIDQAKRKRVFAISYDTTPTYNNDDDEEMGLYEFIASESTLNGDINYLMLTSETIDILKDEPELAMAWYSKDYYGITPKDLAQQIITNGAKDTYTKIFTSLYKEGVSEFKAMLKYSINEETFQGKTKEAITKQLTNDRYLARRKLSSKLDGWKM